MLRIISSDGFVVRMIGPYLSEQSQMKWLIYFYSIVQSEHH